MLLDDFLSSDAYTIVNKKLAKIVGIPQAIYLQELISQRKRFKKEEFYFTQNDMEKELGISPSAQQRYGKELSKLGLINIVKKGVPARNRYTINDETIFILINKYIQNEGTSSVKMNELDKSNCMNYSNKNENKNDNNIIASQSASATPQQTATQGDNNSLNRNNADAKTRVPQLDKSKKVYINSSDDIKETLTEEEFIYYKEQLKILMIFIKAGYKIEKNKSSIKDFIGWLKAKANLYNIKKPNGEIARTTFQQKVDKRYDWHDEKKVPIKNYKTSVIPFISK